MLSGKFTILFLVTRILNNILITDGQLARLARLMIDIKWRFIKRYLYNNKYLFDSNNRVPIQKLLSTRIVNSETPEGRLATDSIKNFFDVQYSGLIEIGN